MIDGLRDQHFLEITRIMEQHTGILLPRTKRSMVEGRLRKRVRTLGLESLEAYGNALFNKDLLADEFDFLVDCITTNKTDFFREPDHFDFLREHAVPALLQQPDRTGSDLKLWSAACSTGAEAYTMALVLAAMQDDGLRMRFSILGTDICQSVLEEARSAVFPSAMLDPVPKELRRRYVMESTARASDQVRVVPELRRLLRFHHLNLMDASYPFDKDIDIIFCRNVLIYFSRPIQQAVLARLSSHLRPGGYLVVGHSESFAFDSATSMTQIAPTVFQRSTVQKAEGRAA